MDLILLKVDDIDEEKDFKIIKIPTGGIVFTHKGHTIQSLEPVQLKMTHQGMFKNTLRNINFAVYTDQSIFSSRQVMYESLFSVLAHENVQHAIYSEISNRCKVVPFYRPVDERALFAMEYEGVNKQMVGV